MYDDVIRSNYLDISRLCGPIYSVQLIFLKLKVQYLYCFCNYRSSHRWCSVKKSVLRNFTKFTGKHLCQSLFFNKVAGPATLLKNSLWHKCFRVNFVKFLRTLFLQNNSGRLLLQLLREISSTCCKDFPDKTVLIPPTEHILA